MSNNEIAELSKKVDNGFSQIAAQFDQVNKRLDNNDKSFVKMFSYMEKRFDTIDKSLESKANKTDIERILKILDGMVKSQSINDDERLVMGHQLDRLDK